METFDLETIDTERNMRYVVHPFVSSEPYVNYCGLCALSASDHNPGPSYVDPMEPQWSTHDMRGDKSNAADLLDDVAATLDTFGRDDTLALWGIVDENAGGIVAYAIGRENAENIVEALNKAAQWAAGEDNLPVVSGYRGDPRLPAHMERIEDDPKAAQEAGF